jgi:hypothetical protein
MAGPEALQVRVSVQSAQISAFCWTCWTFCSGTLHYMESKVDCMFKCITAGHMYPHTLHKPQMKSFIWAGHVCVVALSAAEVFGHAFV